MGPHCLKIEALQKPTSETWGSKPADRKILLAFFRTGQQMGAHGGGPWLVRVCLTLLRQQCRLWQDVSNNGKLLGTVGRRAVAYCGVTVESGRRWTPGKGLLKVSRT